jgi:UDP-3-O-acyl-N-acetylglucosamine deacetylase
MRDAVRATRRHLLAALVSLGIESPPEVPIMDGSAAPFVYLFKRRCPIARRSTLPESAVRFR